MDKAQMDLLVEIMEYSFVVVETSSYLNINPRDEKALRVHNSAAERYKELESIYRIKYGPLKNTEISECPWGYINGPWPWEINFTNF